MNITRSDIIDLGQELTKELVPEGVLSIQLREILNVFTAKLADKIVEKSGYWKEPEISNKGVTVATGADGVFLGVFSPQPSEVIPTIDFSKIEQRIPLERNNTLFNTPSGMMATKPLVIMKPLDNPKPSNYSIVLRFCNLTYSAKREVAKELGYESNPNNDGDGYNAFFKFIKLHGKLDELVKLVDDAEARGKTVK